MSERLANLPALNAGELDVLAEAIAYFHASVVARLGDMRSGQGDWPLWAERSMVLASLATAVAEARMSLNR